MKAIGHVRSGSWRAEEEILKNGSCWVNLFKKQHKKSSTVTGLFHEQVDLFTIRTTF